MNDQQASLFFVLDHAWLPALRTLSLVGARLVPERLARMLRIRPVGAEANAAEDEDDDALVRVTEQEMAVARSPLYVACPHSGLGVLDRLETLTLTDSDLCVAVLPRFAGVTRIELAGETFADLGELTQRFPALRDATVGESTLCRDARSLNQSAVPPTRRIGETPVWVTALGAVATLRTLAIHESEWPRDPLRVAQCCVTRQSRASRREAWRPWLDVMVATRSQQQQQQQQQQPFHWKWHSSEWTSTAELLRKRATCCCHQTARSHEPLLPPCAQAADCVLSWYNAYAMPPADE
jgi:hypothetical protein